MIDTFSAKTKSKTLVVKQDRGGMILIGEPQENGKPKLIDMAIGSLNSIVNDLKNQGFKIEII